eukprot:SAG11_NODE_1655_length_4504_cov_31.952100_3_plen_142_part_00
MANPLRYGLKHTSDGPSHGASPWQFDTQPVAAPSETKNSLNPQSGARMQYKRRNHHYFDQSEICRRRVCDEFPNEVLKSQAKFSSYFLFLFYMATSILKSPPAHLDPACIINEYIGTASKNLIVTMMGFGLSLIARAGPLG